MSGSRTTKVFSLLGVVLVVALAAIACSSEPAPAMDESRLQRIVESAVAKSAPEPQPQISADEIQTMVTSAMMGMAESQVSASEIQSMVEEAVASAAMEGASAEDIEKMVTSAVEAVTADAATSEDVQSAISMAVMEAQEGMITSEDVKSAVMGAQEGMVTSEDVKSAVMEAQEGMVTSEDVRSAVSSAVMEAQEGMVTSEDVKSAVMEAQEGMVTSEDVKSAISSAVMEAQEGMVTSKDVQSAVMEAAANSLTAMEIQEIIAQALEERAMMMEEPKETIVFSDLNWTSAQVQNRIAQYIVEHGYGYPTDVIFGATLPNFQGLQKGDIDVTLEIWLPNQSIGWGKAIELGEVVSVGTSLVGDWQSTFVVPQYIADANPDLKTPQDLMKPKFQELFATADSRGKARLVACVIGWSCELVNTAQIEAYGLTDHMHVINAGSQEAMFAEVYGAYEKEEPWLGYMWGTGDPGLKLDLVRLEEPPYSEECWDADKACAFAESLVLVAVHKSLLPRAPDVIGMLQNWEFSIDLYKSIFQWMDANPGSEASQAAVWFLKNNKVWESWVTREAAGAVNAALEGES